MERPVIVHVSDGVASGFATEVWPLGARPDWKKDADLALLHRRFPGHCPYHLLHNLLRLHYGRHEMCTAPPFSVDVCKHGSHAKPMLTHDQMRADAPAEGALLLLPFGLSCRACDDHVGLVAGFAECELLDDGDVCGGCRRVWVGGQPLPATQLLAAGRHCDLEEWQRAVGLGESDAGGSAEPEECSGEEWWGEEEWEEEEEEYWEDDAEEWEDAEEAEVNAASWEAEGDDGYGGGDGGWQAKGGPAGAGSDDWGAGRWVEDRWGGWSWVVDFAARLTLCPRLTVLRSQVSPPSRPPPRLRRSKQRSPQGLRQLRLPPLAALLPRQVPLRASASLSSSSSSRSSSDAGFPEAGAACSTY